MVFSSYCLVLEYNITSKNTTVSLKFWQLTCTYALILICIESIMRLYRYSRCPGPGQYSTNSYYVMVEGRRGILKLLFTLEYEITSPHRALFI